MSDVDIILHHLREKLLDELGSTTLDEKLQTIPIEVEQPINGLDLISRINPNTCRWYWSSRDGSEEQIGWGIADTVVAPCPSDALKSVQDKLSNLGEESHYIGGFRYDAQSNISSEWSQYGAARFWLPRFFIFRRERRTIFCCHLRTRDQSGVARMFKNNSVRATNGSERRREIIKRSDCPDEACWLRLVGGILDIIRGGEMRKAVLARRTIFEFANPLQQVPFFASLQQDTPGCFHYYLNPGGSSAFLGASPERLLRQEGRHLVSEAVAGTRPRSGSESWDAVLEDELLSSEKDRLEHVHVQNFLQDAFRQLCEGVKADEQPRSMALKRGRHLHAEIRGQLRRNVSLADVVKKLHPTPAVAGLPVKASMEHLRGVEPFDRGWYAGGIGWVGSRSAEFSVGIRSALLRGNELNLYAGAGIVPGSHPPQEWKEVEHKIGDYLAQFQETPAL